MQDERDQLDRVLDSALATYADPGPDSGLERRILSRIANEAAPAPRRRWLAWAIALPVAAGLLLFMLVSHPWSNQPLTTPEANASRQPVQPSIEAARRPAARPAPARRSKASLRKPQLPRKTLAADSSRPPKLDIFPSIQPLSSDEQSLVNFGVHAPQSERESFMAAEREADAPLRITAIEIKPLDPLAAGPN
jgi:hypothetical protein